MPDFACLLLLPTTDLKPGSQSLSGSNFFRCCQFLVSEQEGLRGIKLIWMTPSFPFQL
jgi:hypothetical protein